jgi:hypothetical protein
MVGDLYSESTFFALLLLLNQLKLVINKFKLV